MRTLTTDTTAIVITDDTACLELLIRSDNQFPKLDITKGNQAHIVFSFEGHYWLAVRHFGFSDPRENGYNIVGLPHSVGLEEAGAFFDSCIAETTTPGCLTYDEVDVSANRN